MRLAWVACLAWAVPAAAQQPPPQSPPDAWQQKQVAELILLDKVRALPSPATVRVGQSTSFGTLTITVRRCLARPADLPQDSAALLDIRDSRADSPGFRGWMLTNAPSLAQLEHPIYDVRVASCH